MRNKVFDKEDRRAGIDIGKQPTSTTDPGRYRAAARRPENDWYTEDQLAGLGYRREVITELFGQPTQGPDGLVGWTVASVAKIEETRLAPAYDLLEMAFDNKELDDAADTMRTRVSFDRL